MSYSKKKFTDFVNSGAEPICPSLPKKRFNEERGVAALEMALLLPLLFTILFGIIDWGYVFFVDLSMTNAAREGARVGVTKVDPEEARAAAEEAAQNYLSVVPLSSGSTPFTTNVVMDANQQRLAVTVSIGYLEPLVDIFPDGLMPKTWTTRAVMRWELTGFN